MTRIIKHKTNWPTLLFTGLWLLGFLAVISTVIYGIATEPDKLSGETYLFLAFFFAGSLFILKAFLWNLKGAWKITLDKSGFRILKTGTILTIPQVFDASCIGGFEYSHNSAGGEKIQFSYMDEYRYFGKTFSKNEAISLINELNTVLRTIS